MRWITIFALLVVMGCSEPQVSSDGERKVASSNAERFPVFKISASEYPSWSTFAVAAKAGLINPEEGGEPGSVGQEWGVGLVLVMTSYEACMTMFGNGAVDASCLTNTDTLNIALTRPTTAICPTSTSAGADAVVSTKAKTAADLKDIPVYGLEKSISEAVWLRGLEKAGLDPADFEFRNRDPEAAATALQTGEVEAICVWNPFLLQTLRATPNAVRVYDSTVIPGEVIDLIVAGNDSLKKPKGAEFAAAVCDVFYQVSKMIDDPATRETTLNALKEDFAPSLTVEDMEIVVKETDFYETPALGIELFEGSELPRNMEMVVATAEKLQILEGKKPTLGYGDPSKQFNFDPQYMRMVQQN